MNNTQKTFLRNLIVGTLGAGLTTLGFWAGDVGFNETTQPAITLVAPIDLPSFRDAERLTEWALIERELGGFKERFGTYPNTDGSIQTFCLFPEDMGCLLNLPKEVITDPLGSDYGYWYRSDGVVYTIFATRESEASPPCPEHPEHLTYIPQLTCKTTP